MKTKSGLKVESEAKNFMKNWAKSLGLECAIQGNAVQFLITSPNGSRIQRCFGFDHAHGFLRGYEEAQNLFKGGK